MFNITQEDLEGLLRTIRYNIAALNEGEIERAKFSLEVLEAHLANNLLNDERKVA